MSVIATVRYFPKGLGAEIFPKLAMDPRLRVEPVLTENTTVDYRNNVCAEIVRGDSAVFVGRPNVKGFLHELSRELRYDVNKRAS